MYSDARLTPEESQVLDEAGGLVLMYAEYAFHDFVKKATNHRQSDHHLLPYKFCPRSIEDFHYLDLDERQNTVANLLQIARSERFSQERMTTLCKMIKLAESLKPDEIPAAYELAQIARTCLNSKDKLSSYFSSYEDNVRTYEHLDLTQHFLMIQDALKEEYYRYCGYLCLAQQLIDLGDTGIPDDIIPSSAFYYAYPPSGTKVVAWNYKDPKEKWLGMVPNEDYIGWYAIRIAPIRIVDESDWACCNAGINLLMRGSWFDEAIPADLVMFYLERPELRLKHSQVLGILSLIDSDEWWENLSLPL